MQNSTSLVATPSLNRRLICLVYEAFLVTAVVMLALFLFLFVAQKFDPKVIDIGRQLVLFVAAGVYFIYCWSGSGHTLAMKTWRIKLVKVGCATVPLKVAALRYLFAWLWLLPALAVCWLFRLTGKAEVALTVAAGIVAYALTALLDKDRQFLHDKLAGTRLITLPTPVKPAKV